MIKKFKYGKSRVTSRLIYCRTTQLSINECWCAACQKIRWEKESVNKSERKERG